MPCPKTVCHSYRASFFVALFLRRAWTATCVALFLAAARDLLREEFPEESRSAKAANSWARTAGTPALSAISSNDGNGVVMRTDGRMSFSLLHYPLESFKSSMLCRNLIINADAERALLTEGSYGPTCRRTRAGEPARIGNAPRHSRRSGMEIQSSPRKVRANLFPKLSLCGKRDRICYSASARGQEKCRP